MMGRDRRAKCAIIDMCVYKIQNKFSDSTRRRIQIINLLKIFNSFICTNFLSRLYTNSWRANKLHVVARQKYIYNTTRIFIENAFK